MIIEDMGDFVTWSVEWSLFLATPENQNMRWPRAVYFDSQSIFLKIGFVFILMIEFLMFIRVLRSAALQAKARTKLIASIQSDGGPKIFD